MIIEEFARRMMNMAHEFGTSDVHILPDKENYEVYFRLSGRLEKQYHLSIDEGTRLIMYFKYLANLDVGERRRPQTGSLLFEILDNYYLDIRLSTISNYHGQESIVIRLLEMKDDLDLTKSTFLPYELETLKRIIQYKSGLILFSGPVNSGKTTTMYQLVKNRMKKSTLQVISIEDPVEIKEDSFLQIQVNEKAGNTYEESLKASLRHHPDLVIVGEIRDEETAKMAIRGALTGHLIIASVHAKNAEGVIARMMELGISFDLLKQTLLGIVFQKLLPIYCALCEGNCGRYCSKYPVKNKRAALYDLIDSAGIQQMSNESNLLSVQRRNGNFNDLLRKVYAYGYISEDTAKQYYIP